MSARKDFIAKAKLLLIADSVGSEVAADGMGRVDIRSSSCFVQGQPHKVTSSFGVPKKKASNTIFMCLYIRGENTFALIYLVRICIVIVIGHSDGTSKGLCYTERVRWSGGVG